MTRLRHTVCVALLTAICASPTWAAEPPQTVHWAFSSFFGTGWYQVDDSRSVFVFRMPPRWTISQASWEDGRRQLGWEVHFPVTLGLNNLDFEDPTGNVARDNFGTFSFTPGVEVEIPVNHRWSLRPFGKFGWGKEFEFNESAWIYEVGLKSRYAIPTERIEWGLLANVHFTGYDQSAGDRDDIVSTLLGVEARQPLRSQWWGQDWDMHWHATYSFLNRTLQFRDSAADKTEIDGIIEFGLAFSLRDRPYDFWLWKPDRLGLGIKFSPDGNFSAITFTSRSWFSK